MCCFARTIIIPEAQGAQSLKKTLKNILLCVLTAFVNVISVISLYCVTLRASILNGISESGTPTTYADVLLIMINMCGYINQYGSRFTHCC